MGGNKKGEAPPFSRTYLQNQDESFLLYIDLA